MGDLTAERLEGYRKVRANEFGNGKTFTKPATRNREIVKLSAMLTWAAERQIIPVNPIYHATMETEDNIRQTCPTPTDVSQILLACNRRLRAMVATKFWSGLRRGEVCAVRRDQIEWDDGLIVLQEKQTKTRRPRITIFPDRASSLVHEYLENREVDSPYLFCTKSGNTISGRNFLREYQDAAKRAGFEASPGERTCLHDLRAGFVGQQLELGTPERVVMDMTGHSTHEAFDRYVRVKKKWLIDARERTELADLAGTGRRDPRRAGAAPIDRVAEKETGDAKTILTAEAKSAIG